MFGDNQNPPKHRTNTTMAQQLQTHEIDQFRQAEQNLSRMASQLTIKTMPVQETRTNKILETEGIRSLLHTLTQTDYFASLR